PEQRAKAFMRALEMLESGGRLIVFPEGTRSKTGALGPFQAGVFKLALEARVPLTPVLITSDQAVFNSQRHFRPDGGLIHFTLHVQPAIPLPLAGTARAFRDTVQAAFTRWLSTDLASAYNRLEAAPVVRVPRHDHPGPPGDDADQARGDGARPEGAAA